MSKGLARSQGWYQGLGPLATPQGPSQMVPFRLTDTLGLEKARGADGSPWSCLEMSE